MIDLLNARFAVDEPTAIFVDMLTDLLCIQRVLVLTREAIS